jgi:hypothetical protein
MKSSLWVVVLLDPPNAYGNLAEEEEDDGCCCCPGGISAGLLGKRKSWSVVVDEFEFFMFN